MRCERSGAFGFRAVGRLAGCLMVRDNGERQVNQNRNRNRNLKYGESVKARSGNEHREPRQNGRLKSGDAGWECWESVLECWRGGWHEGRRGKTGEEQGVYKLGQTGLSLFLFFGFKST